jgi:D-alanyl-D-alanine carboxypeptidase
MQLKTKPIIITFIIVFGLTVAAFLITSYFRYTSEQAALSYIRNNTANVAIACLDPANPQTGVYHNGDEAYPLASTFKLVLLAAYADEVAAGRLDPQESLPISDLDQYYLPGTDGGAQPEFLKSIGAGQTTLTLAQIVDGAIRYGSNAATDALSARLKDVDFPRLYQRLGLENTSQPFSFLGLYLFIKNHETGMYAEEDLTEAEVRAEQTRLQDLFVNDPAWRKAETSFISKPTNAAPINVQKQVVSAYGMRGSARDLSRILLAAYGYNATLPSKAQTVMRQHLEWPARVNPENTKDFKILASASGAWPGVLTSAWYAQALEGNPQVLVVLYREMPDDFWNTWITTFTHQQLETLALVNGDCQLFAQAVK